MRKQAQTDCKIFIISHCLYEMKLHYSLVVCSLALDCKLSQVPSLRATETNMVQKRETERHRETETEDRERERTCSVNLLLTFVPQKVIIIIITPFYVL